MYAGTYRLAVFIDCPSFSQKNMNIYYIMARNCELKYKCQIFRQVTSKPSACGWNSFSNIVSIAKIKSTPRLQMRLEARTPPLVTHHSRREIR